MKHSDSRQRHAQVKLLSDAKGIVIAIGNYIMTLMAFGIQEGRNGTSAVSSFGKFIPLWTNVWLSRRKARRGE
jgi:hypothetical protein